MTELSVRKMRFGFSDPAVPFAWNQHNPAFSSAANALSFLAIGFEKMIVATVTEALPLIAEPAVAQEARAFMRQEAQHSLAHRQHVKALIAGHPALAQTFSDVIASYDRLVATTPLKYRLAYTADVEATFTPSFKLMLDNADTLFAGGDDRVASLFLWHFVEEIEHRSSALLIYDAVVADRWYRLRVAPSVFAHAGAVMAQAADDFNRLVPLTHRLVDATSMSGGPGWKKAAAKHFPRACGLLGLHVPDYGPVGRVYPHVRLREKLAAAYGVLRSQFPGHNPQYQDLPALAAEWLARYDAGQDVTRWYTRAHRGDS